MEDSAELQPLKQSKSVSPPRVETQLSLFNTKSSSTKTSLVPPRDQCRKSTSYSSEGQQSDQQSGGQRLSEDRWYRKYRASTWGD